MAAAQLHAMDHHMQIMFYCWFFYTVVGGGSRGGGGWGSMAGVVSNIK